MRLILSFALCVLPAVAIAAANVTMSKSDDASKQFIDKSVVTYPTSLGHYSLVKSTYDPADVINGIGLDYELTDGPHELQFNIYVYPLGRAETPKAVDDAMIEMEGEIRTLEQRKTYSDVKFNDVVAFDVAEPPSSLFESKDKADADTTGEKPNKTSEPPSGKQDADSQAIIDVLRASLPPKRTVGRKRSLTLTAHDRPSQSLAYVFYRNLFLISVRATEPVNTQTPDEFNALVDRAVQDLVPTMDIQNFGTCGTISITLDKESGDKNKDTRAGALQIVQGMGRVQREGCANSPGSETTTPEGHQRQTIVYPAGLWK